MQRRRPRAATYSAMTQDCGDSEAETRERLLHQLGYSHQDQCSRGSINRRQRHSWSCSRPNAMSISSAHEPEDKRKQRTRSMPKTEVMRHVKLKAHLRPMMSEVMPNTKAPTLDKHKRKLTTRARARRYLRKTSVGAGEDQTLLIRRHIHLLTVQC
jgi:hypothetical protein